MSKKKVINFKSNNEKDHSGCFHKRKEALFNSSLSEKIAFYADVHKSITINHIQLSQIKESLEFVSQQNLKYKI